MKMDNMKIEYLILTHKGEVHQSLLDYTPENSPRMMYLFTGYMKMVVNDEVITRYKAIDLSGVNDKKALNFAKQTLDFIGDIWLLDFVMWIVEDCILLLEGKEKTVEFSIIDPTHSFKVTLHNSNIVLSFKCGTKLTKDLVYCHENRDNLIISTDTFFNEIIRSTGAFLDQLIDINPRLKEWKGYKDLEKKFIHLKRITLDNKDGYFNNK